MRNYLINKLSIDLDDVKETSYNEFKDFIQSESLRICEFYDDVERYVMKLDIEDPSYSVGFNKWIEYVLRLLRKPKPFNKIPLKEFIILVKDNLWIEKELELINYLNSMDYSDCLESYVDLLNAMWLSYTVSELTDEWTVVHYELWDEEIIIEKWFDFNYNSYQELYDELYRLESLVINF